MNGRIKKRIYRALAVVPALFACVYLLQGVWAHRKRYFFPDYERVELTETSDYETFFQQTGLGKVAVEKLISEGKMETIIKVQNAFFSKDEVECVPVFGWFTRSDRIESEDSAPLVNLQAGDIILSLSTHSMGWRHGHVGLVLDENYVLECTTLGKKSSIVGMKQWRVYSNYVVLRVKGVTEEIQQKVTAYARENLCDMPYHLSAGFIGEKAAKTDEAYFGLQCAYLAWYAWQQFGYDLDSDGGRLVTAHDLLYSELLEIVQVYGIDPRQLE